MSKNELPMSVRYVKNGEGGKWWQAAKDNNQIHAGWSNIPADLLQQSDLNRIRQLIDKDFADRQKRNGATQDFNALCTLLDRPSQHVWVTFQDNSMWWCTVRDGVVINKDVKSGSKGHFWLCCDRPWRNKSIDGNRHLAISTLPGVVTQTSGHQATICMPTAWEAILRIIRGEKNPHVAAAQEARSIYCSKISDVIKDLRWQDFESLMDMILARTGWARISSQGLRDQSTGGVREGTDIDAENIASGDVALVQIKSSATQSDLNDYTERFKKRREYYTRMIFAVHTPKVELKPEKGLPIQIWTGAKISDLVVHLGLGEWVENKLA